jgi:hypothetical protein
LGIALGLAIRHRVRRKAAAWSRDVRRSANDVIAAGSALIARAGSVEFVEATEVYPEGRWQSGLVALSQGGIELFERDCREPSVELSLEGLRAEVLPPRRRGPVGVVLTRADNLVCWWWMRRTDPETVREALHRSRIEPFMHT